MKPVIWVKIYWEQDMISIFIFTAVPAGISAVKKQPSSIHLKEKGEFHGQNLLSLPTSGLFGQPTVVNNVETLCWIPHIVEKGAEWFMKLSLTGEGGTKIYGVSGRVKKPGLWELPMGTPLREIIEDHAGGMQDGYVLQRNYPGRRFNRFHDGRSPGYKNGFCFG